MRTTDIIWMAERDHEKVQEMEFRDKMDDAYHSSPDMVETIIVKCMIEGHRDSVVYFCRKPYWKDYNRLLRQAVIKNDYWCTKFFLKHYRERINFDAIEDIPLPGGWLNYFLKNEVKKHRRKEHPILSRIVDAWRWLW